MIAQPPVAVIDTLNSLLEAESNSIFQFVGHGSPFLDSAGPDIRRKLETMTGHLQQHKVELSRLIAQQGGTPAHPAMPRAEDQYLAHLSLRFLLPKLVEAKELMIRRHENALRALDGHPEVTQTLDRHLAEMRSDLRVLKDLTPGA